jgi:hypothetical protein
VRTAKQAVLVGAPLVTFWWLIAPGRSIEAAAGLTVAIYAFAGAVVLGTIHLAKRAQQVLDEHQDPWGDLAVRDRRTDRARSTR